MPILYCLIHIWKPIKNGLFVQIFVYLISNLYLFRKVYKYSSKCKTVLLKKKRPFKGRYFFHSYRWGHFEVPHKNTVFHLLYPAQCLKAQNIWMFLKYLCSLTEIFPKGKKPGTSNMYSIKRRNCNKTQYIYQWGTKYSSQIFKR